MEQGVGFAFFYWTRHELNHDDGWSCAGCRWEWALMEAERDRLRAAIEKHRNDMWGGKHLGGEIHPIDYELYEALAGAADDAPTT